MIRRRQFLGYSAGMAGSLALPGRLLAQSGIQLERLNFFEIRVADVERSLAFHRGVFGMPVQSSAEGRVLLKIGAGNHYMAIREVRPGETPAITHYGYAVANYDLDDTQAALVANGFRRIDAPDITAPGIENAMTTWTRDRDGVTTLYFADARGLIVQLTDSDWCGSRVCRAPDSAMPGDINLTDINHFTTFVNGGPEAAEFYQSAFGLEPQAYQATTPSLGTPGTNWFVMFAGGPNNGQQTPANIHHVSFNMSGFIVDDVLTALEGHGVTSRGSRQLGPMMHYISLRQPDRGGAIGGTPEVYFTDPDGILMQIQDDAYCGGSGYLGNICIA